MLEGSRVAVLDLNHGGITIARKLLRKAASVTAIDVYGKLPQPELDELEKEGIQTSRKALNVGSFDVIIAPVHLDTDHPMLVDAKKYQIPVISHHESTGKILSDYDIDNKIIIEITGTKAKTSTSILLGEILSREKRVITHSSTGVEDWSSRMVIKKGLSITPASVLEAFDAVLDTGIQSDIYIFEISLGGTGSADIGVITTISNDYRIANNKKSASEAKRQMILLAKPGSTLVINHDALRSFGACRRDVEIISFSDTVNASCNVYYEEMSTKGGTIAYFVGKRKGRIRVLENRDYDITSYKTAFVCATAVALALNVDDSIIERSINEFKGAKGRMRKISYEGRTLIDNSNSGLDIITARKALSFVKQEEGRVLMILGEEAKEVCEGLNPGDVRKFIDEHLDELYKLILVGERMKALILINTDKIYYTDDLSKGIELAVRYTHEKDIILSCVKCFR